VVRVISRQNTLLMMSEDPLLDILYSDILQQMRLSGASSDVDDALDDIVHDVQADYFGNYHKTIKKSLKPGYARSRFEKS
jgi:hypothetical protein